MLRLQLQQLFPLYEPPTTNKVVVSHFGQVEFDVTVGTIPHIFLINSIVLIKFLFITFQEK